MPELDELNDLLPDDECPCPDCGFPAIFTQPEEDTQ